MKTFSKEQIQAIASQDMKARALDQIDLDIWLAGEIDSAGFDISLTHRPDQWERAVDWLAEALEQASDRANN